LQKIVTEKFCRLDLELAFFDADFFLFMSLSSALALLLHPFLEPRNINSEPALTCHEFGQIQRKSIGVVKFKCNFAGYLTRNTCFRHFDVELHRPIKNRESFIESFVK